MYNKKVLSLEDVKRVVVAAEAEAEQNGWNVVPRRGGRRRPSDVPAARPVQLGSIEVAITKARAALLFRRATRLWEETVASGGYLAMPGMLPIEGGVPLVCENEIVGAIGVSRVKSSEDGQIAEAGARAFSSHFCGPITPPSGRA
jgi:glc operon protein GlcG